MDENTIVTKKNTRVVSFVFTLSYKIVPGVPVQNASGGATARRLMGQQGIAGTGNLSQGVTLGSALPNHYQPGYNIQGEPVPGAEVYLELEPDDEP
jgi:hypothetical protein